MTLVTITQNFGGDGTAIARNLAGQLGVELFDDRRIQELVQAGGVTPDEVERFDEKGPGFLDQIMGYRPQRYLDILGSVIYEVAHKGEGVIVGHGSQLLLRNFDCAFHVRVFTPIEKRVAGLTAQMGLSREAALKLIRKRDQDQSGFFNFAFHLKMDDPSLYDLIIHTGKLDTDAASGLVAQAARSESIRACSLNALEAMEHLALEKKVRAAIHEAGIDLSTIVLEVPEKSTVHVYGLTSSSEETEKIKSTVGSVAGVSRVVSGLSTIRGVA
ncbi:MAG TPA: cytidylate kinase family protein [Desulfosarcina sp.]|nr:cytidylate kinase family protein [Desulfosarcina sp.]